MDLTPNDARCDMRPHAPISVAVVGCGPRGLCIIERLTAAATALNQGKAVVITAIDAEQVGTGSVWRVTQPRSLLMNTVSAQLSVFADSTAQLSIPAVRGPSLYEWSRLAATSHGSWLEGSVSDLNEVRRLGPDDYPSRILFGRYLHWVYSRLRHRRGSHLRTVTATVTRMRRTSGHWELGLADGTVLAGFDHIVYTPGHLGHLRANLEPMCGRRLPPANPADVALDAISRDNTVGINGLGLSFFDYVTRLTLDRGGTFISRADGWLQYRRSGEEPHIIAGSSRGVPHHARAANEKGVRQRHQPTILTPDRIEHLTRQARAKAGLDFRTDIFPLITAEMTTEYRRLCGDETAVLNWQALVDPLGRRRFRSQKHYRAWILDYLQADVARARLGNRTDPLKAALDVLRDIRNEVRRLVEFDMLSPASHQAGHLELFNRDNAFLCVGPPMSRIEELIALIEAGVVDLMGPGASWSKTADDNASFVGHYPRFSVTSPQVCDSARICDLLIDARVADSNIFGRDDPLSEHMVHAGLMRQHRRGRALTGAIDVTADHRIIGASGSAVPGLFCFGIPTEGLRWGTAVGARPHVASVTYTEADAIAARILALEKDRRVGPLHRHIVGGVASAAGIAV